MRKFAVLFVLLFSASAFAQNKGFDILKRRGSISARRNNPTRRAAGTSTRGSSARRPWRSLRGERGEIWGITQRGR